MVTMANLGMPCGGSAAGLAGEPDGGKEQRWQLWGPRAGVCSWSEGRAGVSAGQLPCQAVQLDVLATRALLRGPWLWGGLHWHSRNCRAQQASAHSFALEGCRHSHS